MSRKDIKVTYFSDIVGRFDKQKGMIYGVSVITEGLAKGHELKVDSQTLMEIKNAAESLPDGRLKTKLNHRSGVEAVFGYLENFRVDGPKLLADLKMLKSHKDFEQTFEQIEMLPNQLGLSVAFVGKEQHSSTGEKLARCRELLSADLVPEPAANPTGMFEANTGAVVDTKKISNTHFMNEGNQDPNAQPAQPAAPAQPAQEPTLTDILNFLKEDLMPRLEATEAFQKAIQDEIEAAAAEGEGEGEGEEGEVQGEGQAQGDDGNRSAVAPQAHAQGDAAHGGTRQNGQAGYVPAGGGVPVGATSDFETLRKSVVQLQRKLEDKDNQERETELERAFSIVNDKTDKLVEYAQKLENENKVLLEAVKTGVRPVKASAENLFGSPVVEDDFQSRVQEYVKKGKTKTEAIMLARKDDPASHTKWLESQGVVKNL